MFSQALLFGISFVSLVVYVLSYDIRVGSAAVLLKNYFLNSTQEVESSGLFIRRALIFPYDIYEKTAQDSINEEAKCYIFVKVPYSLLEESFQLQNKSIPHGDQYQVLFRRIPQVVIFQAKKKQYLQLIYQDPSLYNNHFIIKYSTAQKRMQGVYVLHFYSLTITKFLEKIVKSSEREVNKILKMEQKQQERQKIFENGSHFTEELIRSDKNEKNELVFNFMIKNANQDQNIDPRSWLNVEMERHITKDTLWSAKYDRFSIFYSSATIKTIQKKAQGQFQSSQNVSLIDLFIIVGRQYQQMRIQHLKEPLTFLNLSKIKYLEVCSCMQRFKLMIGDDQHIYLLDVTTQLWNLDTYKIDTQFQDVFLDKQCTIIKVINKTVSEVNGLPKIEFQHNIKSTKVLENIIVFCLHNNVCKIYPKNLSKELIEITLPQNLTDINWFQMLNTNNSQIQYNVGYRQTQGHYQLLEQLDSFQIIQTSNDVNYSIFYNFIYPFEVYLYGSHLYHYQMDKIFFHHFQLIRNKEIYQLPANYFQFSRILESPNNCTSQNNTQIDTQIKIDANQNWTICTFSESSNSLVLFKILSENVESKLYICESSSQHYNVSCRFYTAAANTENSYYLANKNHIKFYILRFSKQKHFPKFIFTDLKKQQLAVASTTLFVHILVIAILFFLIILFIILKPVIISLMIYYGWRQDLTASSYPLGWLQLKVKIKKLVQMNFLKYVPHLPRNQDEDNHCCFCLQNLSKGIIIAQIYCEHEFHKECFNLWIKNEPNLRCPTCRREFTQQQLNDFRSTHELIEE